MIEEISLDFNLNEKQLECLEIHNIFKSNNCYEQIQGGLEDEIDQIKVWYDCSYNDYLYDIKPIYFDLISKGKVVDKRSAYSGSKDLEIKNAEEGNMLSFIITPQML